MAYTTVTTFTDTVATTSNFNTYIRDNLRALKDPPSQNYEPNEGADYTKTLVAWADVDTDFNFSITTTGGDVLVSFIGNVVVTGGSLIDSGYLDVSVDGTRIINQTDGCLGVHPNSNIPTLMQFTRIVTGLSAGVHTFKLQWKPSDGANTIRMYAGAGTANYDLHGQFWARELT